MKKRYASPLLVWLLLFILVPMLLIVYYSLTNESGAFSLNNFKKFFDPLYGNILLNSLILALKCTVLCLLIGYPVAMFLSDRNMKNSQLLLVLFVLPMWMNFLLRTYAWMTLLESNGFIAVAVNKIMAFFGQKPIRLLYTENAILMGMVYNFLPFMVLPIHSVMSKLDYKLIEAAQDLGAKPMSVFFKVRFPLSLPGVVTGITMVFMPAITSFAISRLLGGGQVMLFGDLIEQEFLNANDWNFGSALSIIMMVLTLISLGLLNKSGDKEGGALM